MTIKSFKIIQLLNYDALFCCSDKSNMSMNDTNICMSTIFQHINRYIESSPRKWFCGIYTQTHWFPKPPINLPDLYGTHLNIISLFVTICPIVWISIIISNSLLLGLNQPLLSYIVWMEMDSTSKYPLFVKVYFFRDNEC